ncbi:hypothetical protein R3P38DRAFT_2891264 [Favolaschia claudopus]|uniref:F-box domain-containing protein n=1 Tax=Favolaschia claudopus TaxID=2862362 RepID=A0AAW0CRJ5_9AGAR
MRPSLIRALSSEEVSSFSSRSVRENFTDEIDLLLKELDSAYVSLKASNMLPVKQALKLFRRKSKQYLLRESQEEDTTLSLAADVSSGRRSIGSLQLAEISLLQQQLRARRNSLASIDRLPTEILAPIIEFCCPTIDADKPEFRTANFILGLGVSHVCRRWRDIAMSSPKFWTCIVVSRPRWADELLRRSGTAPLSVGIDPSSVRTKNRANRLSGLFEHMSRIQLLHLCLTDDGVIPTGLSFPAPIMKAFYLHYTGPSRPFVAEKLFNAESPKLQHLSLKHCSLPWESPLWVNLVSLELIHSPIALELLATMPRLRELFLENSFNETPNPSAPTTLQLKKLDLTDSLHLCSRFLHVVSIPNSRICLAANFVGSDLRSMFEALERNRVEADRSFLTGLKLTDLPTLGDGPQFEVCIFSRAHRSDAHYIIRLLGDPSLPRWREDVIAALLKTMPFDEAATLTIKCKGLKLSGSLLLSKRFRSIAFYHDLVTFAEPLESDPLMKAADRFDPLYAIVHYPQLRKLGFFHVAISERQGENIVDWLAQRKRLGLGIDEMRLIDCTVTSPEFGSMKELVEHIYTASA